MDLQSVIASVDERFEAMQPRRWESARDPMAAPEPEEYSRVLDPARYQIILQRLEAWLAVLVDEFDARLTELPTDRVSVRSVPGVTMRIARSCEVRSPRPGTLPLLLIIREITDTHGTMPALDAAVASPDGIFELIPDCGCDACDDGSESLLLAIDELFSSLITGHVTVTFGPRQIEVQMLDTGRCGSDEERPAEVLGRHHGVAWGQPL